MFSMFKCACIFFLFGRWLAPPCLSSGLKRLFAGAYAAVVDDSDPDMVIRPSSGAGHGVLFVEFGLQNLSIYNALRRSKSAAISAAEASCCGDPCIAVAARTGLGAFGPPCVVFPAGTAFPGCVVREFPSLLRKADPCFWPAGLCFSAFAAGLTLLAAGPTLWALFCGAGALRGERSGNPGICGHAVSFAGVGCDTVSAGRVRSVPDGSGSMERERAFLLREAMAAPMTTRIQMMVAKSSMQLN